MNIFGKWTYFYFSYNWTNLTLNQSGFGSATIQTRNGHFNFDFAMDYVKTHTDQKSIIVGFQKISKKEFLTLNIKEKTPNEIERGKE